MNIFRKILFFLLRFSSMPFFLRECVQKRRITILYYHKVKPDYFEKHILTLQKIYNIISLEDFLKARQNERHALPKKSLILTLDDGWKDNYLLLPIIKKYQIPVTIFICSGIVGTKRRFWFNIKTQEYTGEALKHIPVMKRNEILADYNFDEKKEYANRVSLSEEEINEMSELVDFQSHTRFHSTLPKAVFKKAENEIVNSKKEIKEKYGFPVYALAFPNGDYSKRDIELTQKAGYQLALSSDHYYNTLKTDPFRLRRLGIRDQSEINELIVRACGLWAFIHKLFFGINYGFHPSTE